jgi:hypothetical protein
MGIKSVALIMGLLFAGPLTSMRASAAECPDKKFQDRSLVYLSDDGPVAFRGEQTTDKIPLDENIKFLYVLDKTQHAPDDGAILVKRVYDIPSDWGDVDAVVTMRRNREREIKNFPADVYESYHENMSLSTSEIRYEFHAKYAGKARTDDSIEKRNVFLYPGSVINSKRKIAKPLVLTWKGFGKSDLACLDFNLNEGEGDYKQIEIYIYEIESRNPPGPPRRTVHLTIVPKN